MPILYNMLYELMLGEMFSEIATIPMSELSIVQVLPGIITCTFVVMAIAALWWFIGYVAYVFVKDLAKCIHNHFILKTCKDISCLLYGKCNQNENDNHQNIERVM